MTKWVGSQVPWFFIGVEIYPKKGSEENPFISKFLSGLAFRTPHTRKSSHSATCPKALTYFDLKFTFHMDNLNKIIGLFGP